MSKYTTEVRFICETESGLSSSEGEASVNDIIAGSRAKIFNFPYPIFDEAYRPVLESKILKHFYTREIGLETVGLWKLKLDTKMNEIMPLYNLYYQSALLEFNPLYTKDLTRKKDVEIDSVNNLIGLTDSDNSVDSSENVSASESNNAISTEDGTANSDTTNRDLYSDTPQGALTGIENETYLTNARKITNDNDSEYGIDRTNSESNNSIKNSSENVNSSSSVTTSESKSGNSVEDYLERVYGFEGGSASKLLKEYRETFLNIDMMVINELEELFMQLW